MTKEKNKNGQIQFLTRPADWPVTKDNNFRIAAWVGDRLLYWGKRIDFWQLAYDRFKLIIKNSINGLLILGSIFGFVMLAWTLYLMQKAGIEAWYFYRIRTVPTLIFWFSLYADFYLYYRLKIELEENKHIDKKKYQPINPTFQAIDWPESQKISQKYKIDVSLYFSSQAAQAVTKAWQLAGRYKHAEVRPVHLLIALLNYDQTNSVFSRLGISFNNLKTRLSKVLAGLPPKGKEVSTISIDLERILIESYFLSWSLRKDKVEITELIESLGNKFDGNEAYEILYDLEVEEDEIFNVVTWLRIRKQLAERWKRFRGRAALKPKNNMNRAMTAIATPVLNAFGQDLTLLARAGYLLPCIGREKEIEQIFQIMQGGTRRSAILIGYPGVGRQTIIEGIAQMMVEENVPLFLQDKRMVSLSISKLVSGVQPAMAQERLLAVLNEIRRSGNIILIISDIHNMIGISAGQKGSIDLGSTLGQILQDGSVLCIASSDPDNYRRYIEGKSVLENVFEPISIKEVSGNEAIQILEAKAGGIEYQNKVYFSYDAIAEIVTLSDRYLHDRYLPEKAIEIMQEVASYVKDSKGKDSIVAENDVAMVVSAKTNIPLTDLTQEESKTLLNLEERIHQRVIGQNEAVDMVASSLRRARAEMREASRPIVNLLFLGPTGVGKTELAKTVAEVYFKAEKNMIRLDMSEYQDKPSVNRLIGAPPGYGDDSGGQLTEAVRKNPFSLVLFDEIEKAHPDVLNLLLQIMDDGRLTDSSGRTVDFTNTIIIATSNAGTAFIQEGIRAGKSVDEIKKVLMDEHLQQYFRPEFLNRFDGIVVFKPLSIQDVEAIAKLMIKKVADSLDEKGVGLDITPAAINQLAKLGYDPSFGARPLRRVIQDRIRDSLANYLIAGKIKRRDVVFIDADLKIKIKKAKLF
ncbi:MAG: ATP-dependent Clp protease ATP-binding subunit [Candidatus Buchananbacteria bacterium]|nr:ATP-dependent Clp protease ATP-binding subunit [Candidatus Buchananbacteria bacterium]